MRIELENDGLNVGAFEMLVVPRAGDKLRLRYKRLGDLTEKTLEFRVIDITFAGDNLEGDRKFKEPRLSRIILAVHPIEAPSHTIEAPAQALEAPAALPS
jgi:hypothetical protein